MDMTIDGVGYRTKQFRSIILLCQQGLAEDYKCLPGGISFVELCGHEL